MTLPNFDLEKELTLIEPCVEDEKLVMGELLLNPGKISQTPNLMMDIDDLCEKVQKYNPQFQNFQCSTKLGIVTFEYLDRKIIITKIGRITVRKALDRKDLLEIFQLILNMLVEFQII